MKTTKAETFERWLTEAEIPFEKGVKTDTGFSMWDTVCTEFTIHPKESWYSWVQVFFNRRVPKMKGKRASESVLGFVWHNDGTRTELSDVSRLARWAKMAQGQV